MGWSNLQVITNENKSDAQVREINGNIILKFFTRGEKIEICFPNIQEHSFYSIFKSNICNSRNRIFG